MYEVIDGMNLKNWTSTNWKETYLELLNNYINDENELSLYRVSMLGKEMVEMGVCPEEVVEAHLSMFKRIVKDINFRDWVPHFYKSFNLLIELMTVFGIAYREHIQFKDELKKTLATQVAYKRLKFYVDEMEFVTGRLATMNEELDKRIMELASLQKISKVINSVLEFDQLLKSIAYSLKDLTEHDSCSISMFDKDNTLILKNATTKDGKPFSESHENLHISVNKHALINREICIIKDLCKDNTFGTSEVEHRSILCVPMLVEKEIIGAITIDSLEPNMFNEEMSKLLSIVAAQAGMAIKNSMTYEGIKKISMTDGLTGVYNHQYFYDRLKTEMDWARHYNLPLSLLMIDIDDFKKYNDTYGHTAGDVALKTVANILLNAVRQEDVVSRYGGEEFAVILVSVDAIVAQKIAERIRQDIMKKIIGEGENAVKSVTASIGCANFPIHAQGTKQLVDCADSAMYLSKKAGKNRVTFSNLNP